MHSLVSPCRAASSRSRSTRQRNQKQKARPFTYHFLAHRILLSVSLSLSKKPPLDFPLKKKNFQRHRLRHVQGIRPAPPAGPCLAGRWKAGVPRGIRPRPPGAGERSFGFCFFSMRENSDQGKPRREESPGCLLRAPPHSISRSSSNLRAPREGAAVLILPFPLRQKLPSTVPAVWSGQSASDRADCSAERAPKDLPNFPIIGQLRRLWSTSLPAPRRRFLIYLLAVKPTLTHSLIFPLLS